MKDALAIILYDHPWEHTSDYASQTSEYLRKQNLVVGLLLKDARSIKEVFFGRQHGWFVKKQQTNCYLIKPLFVIPFRRFQTIVQINMFLNIMLIRFLLQCMMFLRKNTKKYIWIYNPEHYFIVKLFGPSFVSIYDCVDYHGASETAQKEKDLVRSSDWVFVNSNILLSAHKKIRNDVHLVPLGFDLHNFSVRPMKLFIQLPHNQPIIGYIGGINSRLDYLLLFDLVRKNGWLNFVFVGPIQKHESDSVFETEVKPNIGTLFRCRNVYHFGYIPKSRIPDIISQFDICMIPYRTKSMFNANSFPMKLFEYFYMGKPVIATPITELKRFHQFVKIGSTPQTWTRYIKELLRNPWPEKYKKEQRILAENNSWEKKIEAIDKMFIESGRQSNRKDPPPSRII